MLCTSTSFSDENNKELDSFEKNHFNLLTLKVYFDIEINKITII